MQPNRDKPFVALWSGAVPGFCCCEVRVSDTFVATFVKATKARVQIQVYPISPGRRLLAGRQLSLKCILSRLALSFRVALALHQYQGRNPVSSNISLASFRRAIHSVSIALLMVRW